MRQNDSLFTGTIAELYDRHMVPMLFAPYAAVIAERVRATSACRVLETAAGTGVLTNALLDALSPLAEITATDLNEPMMAYAASHIVHPRIRWVSADAQALPFDAQAFDVVVCQFGVMFFPDQLRAFGEARRVLGDGGTFVFSVWDDLSHNDFARVVHNAVAAYFPGDPPRFIARIPHGCADIAELERTLRAAGFTSLGVERIEARSRAPSPREPAVALCQGTPLRNEILARAPDALDAVTDAVAAALAAAFGPGPIEGETRAYVVTARESPT
jgi:ubiquinone/menaquinone biosynthesis C-methylase UbiE